MLFSWNHQPEIATENNLVGFEQRFTRRYLAAEARFALNFLSH